MVSGDDDDQGVSRDVRRSALGALLASDEAIPLSPQHWRAKATGAALCGSYSFAASSRHGVTCAECKRLATERDARLAKARVRTRKRGAA